MKSIFLFDRYNYIDFSSLEKKKENSRGFMKNYTTTQVLYKNFSGNQL